MKTYSLIFLVFLGACKTSGELARGSNYEDPTNVQTVDGPSAAAASEAVQAELATVKGELENLKYSSKQEQDRLTARVAELEAQNKELQARHSQAEPTKAIEVSGNMPKKAGAPLLWDVASDHIRAGKYTQAISPLEELVKSYPKDKLAFPALMNLGMCQYKTGAAAESAVTFNQAIEKYPKKKETALAWFGQGASFAKMKQSDDAKLLFEELIKRYPKTPESTLAKKIVSKGEKVPADLYPLAATHASLFP